MIALDTNALVRLLVEDDKKQAEAVQKTVVFAEKNALQVLIIPEVLIETVWVLESIYRCTRDDILDFLKMLVSTTTFTVVDSTVIRAAIRQYKKGGDFADLLIVGQAKKHRAAYFFSFDKKLQNIFPGYVVEKIEIGD